MQDYSTFNHVQIAAAFKAFAEDDLKGNSDLYYKLVYNIVEDKDLLALASRVRYGQPIPNSILAAVHAILLSEPRQVLAQYYPSITGQMVDEIPFKLFREFCLEHSDEIIPIIQSRIVQTNVIGRCAHLAAVFSAIIANDQERLVTMIDIGTSAGLTLNWDQYEYHYSNGVKVGHSPVMVQCEIRGGDFPAFIIPQNAIRKIGIDQHIIDPTDPGDALWIKALIWPDQLERFSALSEALKIEALQSIEFIEESKVAGFQKVISGIGRDQHLIVYCTHAMYQFPQKMRTEFWNMLDAIGAQRDFFFVSVEGIGSLREKYHTDHTVVELTSYHGGVKDQGMVAETNGHGNWIRWVGLDHLLSVPKK